MSQKLPPSRTAPQFVIRFPDEGMRDRIRKEAEKNGRSMNAEIINSLQSHYDALEREEWESSPEYWEEINRLNQEPPPEGLVGKELHKHIEEMKAQSLAELIAQKVTESLISNEDFLKALKKALSQK